MSSRRILNCFLSPLPHKKCVLFSSNGNSVYIGAYPSANRLCKWGALLITNREHHKHEQEAGIVQALAGIQGSAEPATTAFLREEHALSNGHRLFLLLLHDVRYLHGCQGKSDTVADQVRPCDCACCFWTAGKKKMVLHMVIMFLSLLFNPAMPYCCFLVSLLLSNTCLVVLTRLFFQVWSCSLYCNSTFFCGSKPSSCLPFYKCSHPKWNSQEGRGRYIGKIKVNI